MLDVFLTVARGFKNRPFRPNSSTVRCTLFQVVALGYCQPASPRSLNAATCLLDLGVPRPLAAAELIEKGLAESLAGASNFPALEATHEGTEKIRGI